MKGAQMKKMLVALMLGLLALCVNLAFADVNVN